MFRPLNLKLCKVVPKHYHLLKLPSDSNVHPGVRTTTLKQSSGRFCWTRVIVTLQVPQSDLEGERLATRLSAIPLRWGMDPLSNFSLGSVQQVRQTCSLLLLVNEQLLSHVNAAPPDKLFSETVQPKPMKAVGIYSQMTQKLLTSESTFYTIMRR